MKRRTVLTAALGIAALGSGWWGTGGWGTGGRNARTPLQEFATGGIVFGTTVSLRVLHDDEARARAALAVPALGHRRP